MDNYIVEEVFNEADFPKVTFVKSKYYREIRSSIRSNRKHITLSGPSGCGKTTLLKGLLNDLNILDTDFHEFNGRIYSDVNDLFDIFSKEMKTTTDFDDITKEFLKNKFIIIDDFHHLTASVKEQLGKLLKLWHEKNVRFILVGIASSATELISVDPELGIRNDPYELKQESDEFIDELINLGEKALNIKFESTFREEIIRACNGVPSITQVICRISCVNSDIEETVQGEEKLVNLELKNIKESVLRIFNAKYFDKVVGLAKGKDHARSVHNTYYDIIFHIAKSEKSEISIEWLRSKIVNTIQDPVLKNRKNTSFNSCLKYFAEVIEKRKLNDALYYRKGASYISIEDPSFRFYLTLLDMELVKSKLFIRDNEYSYDVAVSFAGENRAIVEKFVNKSKEKGITVFYDFDVQHELWGKELEKKLVDVYSTEALYMIIFISKDYPIKDWTNFESEVGRNESKKRLPEYILPIKIDDTPIVGLKSNIGHLDLRQLDIERIVEILEQKLLEQKSI